MTCCTLLLGFLLFFLLTGARPMRRWTLTVSVYAIRTHRSIIVASCVLTVALRVECMIMLNAHARHGAADFAGHVQLTSNRTTSHANRTRITHLIIPCSTGAAGRWSAAIADLCPMVTNYINSHQTASNCMTIAHRRGWTRVCSRCRRRPWSWVTCGRWVTQG